MAEQKTTPSESGAQQTQKKRGCVGYLVDSFGKILIVIILFVTILVGSGFYFGGMLATPYIKDKIRFVLGMESEWESMDINWSCKKVTIRNIEIKQPEGFNEEYFFRARKLEFVFNKLTDPTEINLKELSLSRPELIWEFNRNSDSLRRFFEYIHSGKDTETKYDYLVDSMTVRGGVMIIKDYIHDVRGAHIGLGGFEADIKNVTNYNVKDEKLPTHMEFSFFLHDPKGDAASPSSFQMDVNLLTYKTNFKAFFWSEEIDLTVLDPYCVKTMGLHLTKGTLGVKTIVCEAVEDEFTSRHEVQLDYLNFEPCYPGESEEDPWLKVDKWVDRLDAPEDKNKFHIDLNGTLGKDADLLLSTDDVRIRVVFEKMEAAITRWFDGKVSLRRRNTMKDRIRQ